MERDDWTALHDFRAGGAESWTALDDRVMGGVSRSRLVASGRETALFRGHLTTDRGGGFASVRAAPETRDLSDATGLALRGRGDGRTYRLRLRTDADLDGVTWQAAFATEPDIWRTWRLPFEAFAPSFRGRPVPDAAPLDRTRVTTVGLLVGDGQVGDFELELEWIAAFRGEPT